MGGKQSRERTGQDQALFAIRSTSLESISTSASQRTLQSNGTALPHSPSLDGISHHHHTKTTGKATTKDCKGNAYILLDSASVATTEFDTLSEKIDAKRVGANPKSGEGMTSTDGNGEEGRGGGEERAKIGGSDDPQSTLANRELPTREGGVSTKTATELASKRGSRHENKNKLVQRVLPTRSQSSRIAVKPATAVVAPEQREMEREVQQLLKSMLKQQQQQQVPEPGGHTQTTRAKSTSTAGARDDTLPSPVAAQLPKSLLQCSQQELNHLASYICHTIKDTLQSSLVEQALTAQQQKMTVGEKTTQEPSSHRDTDRHVHSREDLSKIRSLSTTDGSESQRNYIIGNGLGCGEGGEARETEGRVHRRRHKLARRERPVSSPGVYCEEDTRLHLSDPPASEDVTGASQNSPSHELQSQTHSNEESYYHRCGSLGGTGSSGTTSTEVSPRSKTVPCRACREHSRKLHSMSTEEPLYRAEQRRKRAGRSKDIPVDVSLDDNCPGVNLIRRRYTHHRHVVCENCLQSLGKDSRPSRRLRQKQQQTAAAPVSSDVPSTGGELQLRSHDNRHEAVPSGVGEGSGFITLYQLRTVAQILRDSTGCVEDDANPKTENNRQKLSGAPRSNSFRQERRHNHHQYRVKGKQKSVVFDDCLSTIGRPVDLDTEAVGPVTRHPHLKELAYPMKSRSGRDSPATDMAVIDLSINSPCMLRPLNGDTSEPTTTTSIEIDDAGSSLSKITHLHHHYHHIIHHGEP